MRIQVHDFGGYAFQADLSRHLAQAGHIVQHTYSPQYSSNRGDFDSWNGPALAAKPVRVAVPAEKYRPLGRLRFELAYADAWIATVEGFAPDLVVAANVPLVSLARFAHWAARRDLAWVLWHQDIVSRAMTDELTRRLPNVLARTGAWILDRLEGRAARSAELSVVISDSFQGAYRRWGVSSERVHTVPNWAPLQEIRRGPRENEWSGSVLPDVGLPRVMYAGTLGRKHRPALLVRLASRMAERGVPIHLIVVSEGESAESIRCEDGRLGDSRVTVLPFQPAAQLPLVLASADVLVALLEPEAALYSIPSKVLTYLAAGRPVLGLMGGGQAADDIVASGGHTSSPDSSGVDDASTWLASALATGELERLGVAAREYAERHFDGDANIRRIEQLVTEAAGARSKTPVGMQVAGRPRPRRR